MDSWSSSSDLDSWGELTANSGFISQETSTVHTGGGSSATLWIQSPSGAVSTLVQSSILVTSGQDYIFAVWVLDNFAYTYIRINASSGSNGPVSDDTSASDSASWRQLSVTITADGNAAEVYIEAVQVNSGFTETVYADDATLTATVSEFPFQTMLIIGFPLMFIALILVKRRSSQ